MTAQEKIRLELPTAQDQTSLAPEETLNTSNAGVIVERTAQLKAEFRSEGRKFARDLSEYINQSQKGIASIFVYEETFGTKDKLHWIMHIRSLADYEIMVQMGTRDENYRQIILDNQIPEEKGGGGWDRMVVDGTLQESVMLPQFWKMYGTEIDLDNAGEDSPAFDKPLPTGLPPARHQTSLPDETILHSANAGIVMHRVGQLDYEFRSEGRRFAREVVDSINDGMQGEASAFLYEEAFGSADRIHWYIHLKSLSTYYSLIKMHAMDSSVREIYFKERISAEKGGGSWSRMFVPGRLVDTALTPQHWGMYATRSAAAEEKTQ